MADTKISALPAATTPLGGTEVLPLVQGGITEKVSVANLTAGRSVSALQFQAAINSATAWAPDTSTTNIQINNSAAAANSTALYVATVNDDASTQGGVKFGAVAVASGTSGGYSADFVIANRKTGTYQENMRVAWNGNVTVNTGNLVIGTSGNGIDFSATPGTGTGELLNDYEEGTWTPTDTSGAGLTFTPAQCIYTKVGRIVTLSGVITFPTTASTAAISIGGLPFTQSASNTATAALASNSGIAAVVVVGGSTIFVRNVNNGDFLNANLSGLFFFFSTTYTV